MGNINKKLEEIQSVQSQTQNTQSYKASHPTETLEFQTQSKDPYKRDSNQQVNTSFIKLELPHQTEMLSVGWLINEIERKIKEQKCFDVTSQLLRDKRIVALKCKTSKSECMDYLLTQPLYNIQFVQDRDILETVYANNKLKKKRKPYLEDFDFLKVIGRGGFSTVYQVRKKDDGMLFAMKALKKSQIKRENKVRHVMNERQILSQVQHPFIVKMHWAFQSEHYLFMVLEFCAGGEIFYHMNKVQRFSEKVAKFYFAEIVLAIEYLHANNIFYRDLKPENILLDEDGHIKLADFGISRINFSERDRSTSFCGSPEYMSPEMLKQGRVHGRCVDFYALGALLYEMLTGLPPHFSENRDEMYRRILHNQIEYPRYLSPMARSMLKALMVKNPDQRLGATFGIKELKDHPFCRDIDWDAVLEKRTIPPIRPSMRYSNFDPEYTSQPVRFTFEEDLVRNQYVTRRKSDPGIDNYVNMSIMMQQIQNPYNNIPNNHNEVQQAFQPLVSSAIVYPNFAYERKGDSSFNKTSQNSQQKTKTAQLNNPNYLGLQQLQQQQLLLQQQQQDYQDDQSPNYSRPPSSTFRGYSFMNFRNDSVSSGDHQMTFSEISQKKDQKEPQQTKERGNSNLLQPQQTSGINPQLAMKTHTSNIFNIIEDYQFTSSQRSRTISFANQSIMTEGIEQKNIYQMDFQGFNPFFNEICFKANEFEFNAYNHQFPKRWQLPTGFQLQKQHFSQQQQRPYQSFIGLYQNSQGGSSGGSSQDKQNNQLTPQIVHLQEQVLYNDVINNFEYSNQGNNTTNQTNGDIYANIWGISHQYKKMADIIEDQQEYESVMQDSIISQSKQYLSTGGNQLSISLKKQSSLSKKHQQLYQSKHNSNEKLESEGNNIDIIGQSNIMDNQEYSQVFGSKRQSNLMIEKVTSKLIQDKTKELDKYSKNLIRFNDEINNVKTERKRKLNTQKELQNINTNISRKGAQSQYTTVTGRNNSQYQANNLVEIASASNNNLNQRLRVESNYTTRSGGGDIIGDVSQDRGSYGSKKKLQQRNSIKRQQQQSNSNFGKFQQKKSLGSQTNKGQPKQLVVNTSSQKQQQQQQTPKGNLLKGSHARIGSQILSPKTVPMKLASAEVFKQANKSIINSPSNNVVLNSPNIKPTKLQSKQSQQNITIEEKKSQSQVQIQSNSQIKNLKQQQTTTNLPKVGMSSNKSRNLTQNTANSKQNSSAQLINNSIQEKKQPSNSQLLNNGQLEQIDEFSPSSGILLSQQNFSTQQEQQQQSQQIQQQQYNVTKTYNNLTLNTSQSQQQNKESPATQRPIPKKKLSRLNSPKMIDHAETPKNSSKQSAVQIRNRVKTNSQYSTPQHFNEFKNLLGLNDLNKNSINQKNKMRQQNQQQQQMHMVKEDSIEKRRSKNSRIPRSQEREIKSNSDNTIEDLDENMEEFKNGENQNRKTLKNPSLMTSIQINSTKHKENSKDYNSVIISTGDISKMQTPEQMILKSQSEQKQQPGYLLGQQNTTTNTSNTSAIITNNSFLEQKKQQEIQSKKSSIMTGKTSNKQVTNELTTLTTQTEDESFPKQAHQHSKSSHQHHKILSNGYKSTNTNQQNQLYQTISQQSYQQQRIESPKLQAKSNNNVTNNSAKTQQNRGANRHSLWSSKRSDIKTPIKFDNKQSGTQKHIPQMIIDNIDDLEEIKLNDRVITEVCQSSNQNEEKMLLSSSEKKFKNSDHLSKTQASNGKSSNSKGQVQLRLTISQVNENNL